MNNFKCPEKIGEALIALAPMITNDQHNNWEQLVKAIHEFFNMPDHSFMNNDRFVDLFIRWKSAYLSKRTMSQENHTSQIRLLDRVSGSDVDYACAILENALLWDFMDLEKSAEKTTKPKSKPAKAPKTKETSMNQPTVNNVQNKPDLIEKALNGFKYAISENVITILDKIPTAELIQIRGKLPQYKIVKQ